ncbi:MAG TPA: ATP-binding protein [Candidatus Limnocylindria bacterium]|nr:ATP-binding protein [Candidatus Limnocylindria bacterium]
MTALELINLVTQLMFIGLFLAALPRAVQVRSRASLDTLLLFGSVASVLLIAAGARWLGIESNPALTASILVLLALAPVAMVRLVDDFRGQPAWVTWAAYLGFVLVAVLSFTTLSTAERPVEIALIGFFGVVGGYAALAFAAESRRSRGITRRRMAAVALGAALFVGAIVLLLLGALVPSFGTLLDIVTQLAALGSVLAFWLGFLPPAWVRRTLREPELRRFIDRSTHIAGVGDDRDALPVMQAAVADAFGATGASIGIADPDRPVLRYVTAATGDWIEYPADGFIAGRAFTANRSIVYLDAPGADPENADTYRGAGAVTALATPIRRGGQRLGVLVVYARREPIFTEDDVTLLELLADQVGILLETRRLVREVAAVSAREETARMKEEFLASAAHDLRSPLTVVLGQAEILERRVLRDPERPVDAAGVSRMARGARRLRDLVNTLLDAQRLEHGGLGIARHPVDLGEVLGEIDEHLREEGRPIALTAVDRPLVALVDRARIAQVVMNLVENARKYGADGGEPAVEVTADEREVRVAVIDHGIGIPDGERERIFERFYRATNAQRVTDTGLGLGLYICRRIVEEHGGTIRHEATPGGGSTFVATLPLIEQAAPAAPVDDLSVVPGPPFVGEAPADA